MKKIVLFSNPTENNTEDVLRLIFPKDFSNKVFAYMPADGGELAENSNEVYAEFWQNEAKKNGFEFQYINNSSVNPSEVALKIENAGVLLVTGGTCKLIENLRKTGLVNSVKSFLTKKDYIYGGFSAGAMLLTPSFKLASLEPFASENNAIGITDFTALNQIDFELFPHYNESFKALLEIYRATTENSVIPLSEDDYMVLYL